jgi:hypothetical protein
MPVSEDGGWFGKRKKAIERLKVIVHNWLQHLVVGG